MSTLNKIMLIGHLGDEVKIHFFDNGGCIARFPLATNESWTNKQTGEKTTRTDWHNIVVKNKAAEVCEKYLSKGDKVYIEGKSQTRKYQAEDGSERYTTEVNAETFKFLTTKGKDSATASSGSAVDAYQNKASDNLEPEAEDDLPF